jgi:hypothetical protein
MWCVRLCMHRHISAALQTLDAYIQGVLRRSTAIQQLKVEVYSVITAQRIASAVCTAARFHRAVSQSAAVAHSHWGGGLSSNVISDVISERSATSSTSSCNLL